jgi:hypothetical protein
MRPCARLHRTYGPAGRFAHTLKDVEVLCTSARSLSGRSGKAAVGPAEPAWKAAATAPSEASIGGQAGSQCSAIDRG